nr:immunoglobulin heavy chain junction region [Mus musculus]
CASEIGANWDPYFDYW